MLTVLFYFREEKFYTDNICASKKNFMSAVGPSGAMKLLEEKDLISYDGACRAAPGYARVW